MLEAIYIACFIFQTLLFWISSKPNQKQYHFTFIASDIYFYGKESQEIGFFPKNKKMRSCIKIRNMKKSHEKRISHLVK